MIYQINEHSIYIPKRFGFKINRVLIDAGFKLDGYGPKKLYWSR